jgi:rare lipoprotein A
MGLSLLLSQGCALLQRPPDIAAPSPPQPPAKTVPAVELKLPQTGEASWYGAAHQGKLTASGQKFDQARLTAAHRSLPFGTKIKVTNLGNGKTVEVEINDRGPFVENRIIDLSHAAAKALEMKESGTATVRLELASGS